jgi:hypothetical protein
MAEITKGKSVTEYWNQFGWSESLSRQNEAKVDRIDLQCSPSAIFEMAHLSTIELYVSFDACAARTSNWGSRLSLRWTVSQSTIRSRIFLTEYGRLIFHVIKITDFSEQSWITGENSKHVDTLFGDFWSFSMFILHILWGLNIRVQNLPEYFKNSHNR